METYFEGEFEYSEANVKELQRYYEFKAQPNNGLLIFSAFLFIAHIWLNSGIGVMLITLLVPLIFVVKYLRSVKLTLARNSEAYGDQLVNMYMSVTEDTVFVDSSVGQLGRIEFSSIKQIVLTKNLIILRTKAKQYVAFEKTRFKKGTWEDFVAFMKSKGMKVKNDACIWIEFLRRNVCK